MTAPKPLLDDPLSELDAGNFERDVLLGALALRGGPQQELFSLARARREAAFPAREVEVRSVIEISNVCQQSCNYCSMAKGNDLKRYMLKEPVLLEKIEYLCSHSRRVLLIQSGENRSQTFVDYVGRACSAIKAHFPEVEIILCLGNLSRDQYRQLKETGVDRYVIKFESSNADLYERWKPSDTLPERLECIQDLIDLGFKVGTGNMVGLPGQTLEDVADDVLLVHRFDAAMMSATVFIPNENCAYRGEPIGEVDLAFNVMALMRIMNPNRLMPTTSCLEKARSDGQWTGLMAGANTVTIHDGTPETFKQLFQIYSTDRCTPGEAHMRSIVQRAGLQLAKHPLI